MSRPQLVRGKGEEGRGGGGAVCSFAVARAAEADTLCSQLSVGPGSAAARAPLDAAVCDWLEAMAFGAFQKPKCNLLLAHKLCQERHPTTDEYHSLQLLGYFPGLGPLEFSSEVV